MFLLAAFFMLIFSVFWRITIANFFHCLNVDGVVRNLWQKNLKFNVTIKKCNRSTAYQ